MMIRDQQIENEKSAARGWAAMDSLIDDAKNFHLDGEYDHLQKLAALSLVEYDQQRKQVAEQLKIRPATLDREVAKLRKSGNEQSSPLFPEIEPWPEPVDGIKLLDSLCEFFTRYLVLPKYGEIILSLWVLHTHALDAFYHSPRINARSAEKGSGKTTLLDLLAHVCPRALRLDNATPAITFRLVDQYQPTMLIDEHDSFLRGNEELRGALNSGHRRGGIFPRCVGDDNEVKLFRVFAATALAGIGKLPDTLADRSIVIEMKRAKRDENPARYDSRCIDDTLQRICARWAMDNMARLKAHNPEIPEDLYNRAADNWRPLITIADAIGDHYPETTRKAAMSFSTDTDQDSRRVMLLQDIHDLFNTKETEKLSSAAIVEALADMEERPWPEYGRAGKPITKKQLAGALAPFQIKPKQIWVNGCNERGYEIDQFADVFSRYLSQSARTLERSLDAGYSDISNARHDFSLADEIPRKAKQSMGSSTLADQNTPKGNEVEI